LRNGILTIPYALASCRQHRFFTNAVVITTIRLRFDRRSTPIRLQFDHTRPS